MMRRTLLWLVNFEPIFMPALSPSMESGTIVEWKKRVGDLVKENEVFCTIQTDKAVVDYTNTFDAGYLAKIYCRDGQSAPVAKTIAVMVGEAADVSKADEFTPEGEEPAMEASAPAVAAAPSAAGGAVSAQAPEGVSCEPIFMPALSPSMESGTIVEWKKRVGDLVKENEVFCTIQTDKAVVDYTNTFDAGYLAKIYCRDGQSAPVAKTIAVMVGDAVDVEKVANYYPEDAVGGPPAVAASPSTASATPSAHAAASPVKHYGGSIDAAVAASGPSVMRIAAGLKRAALAGVSPSGKGGRFVKSDFAGQPGYDYNDAAPADAMQRKDTASAGAGYESKTSAKSAAPALGVCGGIYNVVLKPAPVYKSVSDTALLKKLISSMYVPKPAAKKAAK
ncbi:hypothetical protein JKF63_05028 [Porcisia hertigi]|uniref:Lipoyl-binding domain-containing protein n=1 Tax=Porcisia hertigi TaxID=2761500 RepID=A0A836IWJ5_9TRYP|nr:hypothetical protein JKF63_05028 [Porcisia hertigi]